MFKVSHNTEYLLFEDKIYSIKEDKVLLENELDGIFWLNFFKNNLKESFIRGISDESTVKKLVREASINLSSNLLKENFSLRNNIKVEKLLSEDITKENVSHIVDETFRVFDIKNLTESELEENWFTDAASAVGGYIKQGFNYLKQKGIDTFFEALRKALYSWGGVAVQTFLSVTGGFTLGIGPALNLLVWSLMLGYDILNGFTTGEWDYLNIVIDIVCVATMGGGSAVAGVARKIGINALRRKGSELMIKAGIKGAAGSQGGIIQSFAGLSTTAVGRTITNVVSKLVGGLQKYFLEPLAKAGKWFAEKFGSSLLSRGIQKVGSWMTTLGNGLKALLRPIKNGWQGVTGAIERGATRGASNVGASAKNALEFGKATKGAAVAGGVAYGFEKLLGGGEEEDLMVMDNDENQIEDMEKFEAAVRAGLS